MNVFRCLSLKKLPIKGLTLTLFFFISVCFSYAQSSDNYFHTLYKSVNDSPIKEWVKFEKTEHKPCQEKDFKPTTLIQELKQQEIDFQNPEDWTPWLDFFCKNKNNTSLLIALSEAYFPYSDSVLLANKLPSVFRYLPIALSAMNQKAEWKSGAGLWHLYIPYLVKSGLVISPQYDQRLDPNLAAVLAAKHLKLLYSKNNSIKNTLLSYTFGPFPHKNQKDFYTEKDFIDAFTAIVYLFEYKETLHFPPAKLIFPETKQLLLKDSIQLGKEKTFNISSISLLNPVNVTGFYKSGETIIVLKNDVGEFTKWIENSGGDQQEKVVSVEKIYHKVKSGDTLSGIALKYGVGVSELMQWNNLSTSRINLGQDLIIFKKH